MKSLEDFKNHFTDEIAPTLNRLERQRKIARNFIIIFSSIIAFILIHGILYFGFLYNEREFNLFEFTKDLEPNMVFAYSLIAFFIVVILFAILLKFFPFKKNYKEEIIRPIIDFISSDFIYEPKKHVSNEVVRESKTIIAGYNKLSGDDFVSGNIHGHPFEISEIIAEKESRDKKDKQSFTVFHGLFFHSTIMKKFDGYVLLQPAVARFLRDSMGKRVDSAPVELADMTMSENFVCYSNDDINARKILTPKLIDLINKFSEKYKKRRLAISIIDDKLYVGINYFKNLFEGKYFTSVKDLKHPMDYYSMLVMITNILDDLDLA
ncbi:MAG: DUF3137 domain-containing protein [Brumimicrobium sp.]